MKILSIDDEEMVSNNSEKDILDNGIKYRK